MPAGRPTARPQSPRTAALRRPRHDRQVMLSPHEFPPARALADAYQADCQARPPVPPYRDAPDARLLVPVHTPGISHCLRFRQCPPADPSPPPFPATLTSSWNFPDACGIGAPWLPCRVVRTAWDFPGFQTVFGETPPRVIKCTRENESAGDGAKHPLHSEVVRVVVSPRWTGAQLAAGGVPQRRERL